MNPTIDALDTIMIIRCGHVFCKGCLLNNEKFRREYLRTQSDLLRQIEYFKCSRCRRKYHYQTEAWVYNQYHRKRFWSHTRNWTVWRMLE